jgi:hypothetical protein
MEEVFRATFIANEPEALVNQKSSNRTGSHSRTPPMRKAQSNPKASIPELFCTRSERTEDTKLSRTAANLP